MDLSTILFSLGATGFFASRAFIPAFFTAVFLRYGEHFPWLGELDFLQKSLEYEPTWFTNNFTIMGLGALAIVEVGATKIPEAQELLNEVNKYAKTGLSALTTMGVLSSQDSAFVESTISMQAGVFDMVWSGAVASVVYFFSTLRNDFFTLLNDADADDDLGLQKLISWFEDIWSSVGIYFFLIFPLIILTILGVIVGFFLLCKQWVLRKEELSKKPCPNCQTSMYACATACPSCNTKNEAPLSIGFFSQTINKPADNIESHKFRLVSKRRCSQCATAIKERKLPQSCPTCSHSILSNVEDRDHYLSTIKKRLPKVLGITFLLSLIPILGIIPGIIYYRVQLIAPLRAYIPASRGFALKWLTRLIFFVLITLQIIPGAGGFVLPAMALISYSIYKGYFLSMINDIEKA